ncbi:MAG: hypothetical protein K6G05_00665 [Lachnospiraceae bacterium]|nr:hypothetical protein [Lachnospiraceae bacterium]
MLRRIFYELKKIEFYKYLLVMLVILLIGNMGISFLYNEDKFDSIEELEEEKQIYIDAVQSVQGEDQYGVVQTCEEEISIIDYCINNDIPYKQLTIWGNIAKNRNLLGVVLIILLLAIHSVNAVEDDNNTWKNMVVANQNDFRSIFYRKIITIYSLILLLLLFFVGFIVIFGAIRYGTWSNINLYFENDKLIVGTYNFEIIELIVSFIVQGMFYGSVVFLISCIIKKSRTLFIIPIVVMLLEGVIASILERFKNVAGVLPFAKLRIIENLYSYSKVDDIKAIVYILLCIVVMHVFAYYMLRRKVCGLSVVGVEKYV